MGIRAEISMISESWVYLVNRGLEFAIILSDSKETIETSLVILLVVSMSVYNLIANLFFSRLIQSSGRKMMTDFFRIRIRMTSQNTLVQLSLQHLGERKRSSLHLCFDCESDHHVSSVTCSVVYLWPKEVLGSLRNFVTGQAIPQIFTSY